MPPGLFYGLGSFTFLLSVFNTATANVVFIVAFTSMFAAVLSWIFLKERPSNATLVTMAIMVFGVGLIVQDGLKSGNFFGDAMAVCSALLLASAITVSRASGRDMGLVPLATAIFPAIVGYLLSPAEGLAITHPGWIMFDGLIMIPLAFFCLATGPRYLSAPEVGMFYLLETILAPIWIWIVFAGGSDRADAGRRCGADPGAGRAFGVADAKDARRATGCGYRVSAYRLSDDCLRRRRCHGRYNARYNVRSSSMNVTVRKIGNAEGVIIPKRS